MENAHLNAEQADDAQQPGDGQPKRLRRRLRPKLTQQALAKIERDLADTGPAETKQQRKPRPMLRSGSYLCSPRVYGSKSVGNTSSGMGVPSLCTSMSTRAPRSLLLTATTLPGVL